jgi:hypothetical protein
LKFTLTYEGELRLGSKRGSDGRTPADRKQALRLHFHQQLRRFWQVNNFLKGWSKRTDAYSSERMEEFLESISPKIDGTRFIPLISRSACVDCWIDMRILRPGHDLVNAPDIDNQVKVLFDGLKMPMTEDQMGENHKTSPDRSPNPLYVLLEDDSLVSKLTSTQDELLQPVSSKHEVEKNDVRVLIDVHIRPQIPTPENVIFYSDDAAKWDHGWYDELPENLSGITNSQLKAVATQCIFRIRALAEAFGQWNSKRFQRLHTADESEEERRAAWNAETSKMIDDSDAQRRIWQHNLWPKARAIKEELDRRLDGEAPYPKRKISVAIDHGMLAGPHPLADAAAEIESLVRRVI